MFCKSGFIEHKFLGKRDATAGKTHIDKTWTRYRVVTGATYSQCSLNTDRNQCKLNPDIII